MSFAEFFETCTGFPAHPWQAELGSRATCKDALIRIPTGLGKTAGVGSAWLHHRVRGGDRSWPTRLAWVLPMRVLVEQTLDSLQELVQRAGLASDVDVVPCMGGLVDKEYAVHPERPTILVGTQDMLLSRALMRGYAAGRGRWPVDFGLLSRDTLFVCDEVQLMGVGLRTSAQLAAFRGKGGLRPSRTWWMSATLRPDWLETVDQAPAVPQLVDESVSVLPTDRADGPWTSEKRLTLREDLGDPKALAEAVRAEHAPGTLTLVIVNQVRRAVELHGALEGTTDADLCLVHSRFRPAERAAWRARFLSRTAELPAAGRVVVSTQVIEAGVDISAQLLITELAPWPSLVQRFGRAARYPGERAEVWVVGPVTTDKDALPYELGVLSAAWSELTALRVLGRCDLKALADFEASLDKARLGELFPAPSGPVLRRKDVDDLFDTTPDLSGADIDVGPFVREGKQRDLRVFWRELGEGEPDSRLLPHRDELCAVPISGARKWLASCKAWWLHDFGEGWSKGSPALSRRLSPGRTVVIHAREGGYDPIRGWTPSSKPSVRPVPTSELSAPFERTATTTDSEALSRTSGWRTIATHGEETGRIAASTVRALGLPEEYASLLALAGRWHDVGKAHPVFQACMGEDARREDGYLDRVDLAKAPRGWRFAERRGFRHELASALALLDLLHRARPDHPALRAGVGEMLDRLGPSDLTVADLADHPLAAELAALSAEDFDLLLWLVVTHHGKVRSSWSCTPHDQRALVGEPGVSLQIHGVRSGDRLPSIAVAGRDGAEQLPELRMNLAIAQVGLDARFGRSWAERAEDLLARHGPFDLAYLEALLRSADARASQLTAPDPRLP